MGEKVLFKRRVKHPSGLVPLARLFCRHLTPGTVVCLTGELGAGKTTFVRAVCRHLGVAPHSVRSPSFTLVNEYEGQLPIFHIDLYRLADTSEVAGLGLDSLLCGRGLCFIEWPERILDSLRRRGVRLVTVHLTLDTPGGGRLVTIVG